MRLPEDHTSSIATTGIARAFGIVGVALGAVGIALSLPLFLFDMAATGGAVSAVTTTLMSSPPPAILLTTCGATTLHCANLAGKAKSDLQQRQDTIEAAMERGEMPQLSENKWLSPEKQPYPLTIKATQFMSAAAVVAGGAFIINALGLAAIGTASAALMGGVLGGAALLALGTAGWKAAQHAGEIGALAHDAANIERQQIQHIQKHLEEEKARAHQGEKSDKKEITLPDKEQKGTHVANLRNKRKIPLISPAWKHHHEETHQYARDQNAMSWRQHLLDEQNRQAEINAQASRD